MSVITETAERDDQYIRQLQSERDYWRSQCKQAWEKADQKIGDDMELSGLCHKVAVERDAALERERQKDRQIADLREAAKQVRLSVYAHGLEGNDIVRMSYDAYLRLIRALAKANQSEPTEGTPEDSNDR